MKQKLLSALTFFTLLTLLAPQIALADPLTGANSDVGSYVHYAMMLGGLVDDTTDANDNNEAGDVSWTAGGNPETQYRFIGHETLLFGTVYVDVSTVADTPDQDLNVQYYDGNTWENLTLDAQTHPFDTTGVNSFSFTIPGDWATNDISEFGGGMTTAYYIRINGSSGNHGAAVSQISLITEGGETVPEFSDYLYMITLAAGGWYIFTRMKKFQLGGGNGGMAV